MSSFPGTPKLIKGGLVLLNATTSAIERIVTLQYNPDSLSRSLQAQTTSEDGHNRSQPLRLKGPPVETIKLDAEIDATDQMELGTGTAASSGIFPQLAALEMIVYPSSDQLMANNSLATAGGLEILPMETPLALFVWSKNRVQPVRITEFSITEEAFDPLLNPIRARISLGFRVLSIDDLGFGHRGGALYMAYQVNKERLAASAQGGSLTNLGLNSLP